jgi:hypothetical protein
MLIDIKFAGDVSSSWGTYAKRMDIFLVILLIYVWRIVLSLNGDKLLWVE